MRREQLYGENEPPGRQRFGKPSIVRPLTEEESEELGDMRRELTDMRREIEALRRRLDESDRR